MKQVIISTTVNPVTEAIRQFDVMPDWELIVIGDKKTPSNYHLQRGTYVTPQMQEEMDKELSDAIGWNCIQRRNFGLLLAKERNADVVALVDDDNIPTYEWGKNLILGKPVSVNAYHTDLPVFDPVGATNEKKLWYRGFPLQLLSKRDYSQRKTVTIEADVQADFWDGDPDIDAICRMEHAPNCRFDVSCFPIASNQPAPFNSQNTFLKTNLLKDYFLFPHIGRMDDIWASFYVQAKGAKVVFAKPSVYQIRNEHDLIGDMRNEYLGYENNLNIVNDLANEPEAIRKFLPARSALAFDLYRRHF